MEDSLVVFFFKKCKLKLNIYLVRDTFLTIEYAHSKKYDE